MRLYQPRRVYRLLRSGHSECPVLARISGGHHVPLLRLPRHLPVPCHRPALEPRGPLQVVCLIPSAAITTSRCDCSGHILRRCLFFLVFRGISFADAMMAGVQDRRRPHPGSPPPLPPSNPPAFSLPRLTVPFFPIAAEDRSIRTGPFLQPGKHTYFTPESSP
jgi:hypothetical protein